jgi:microcystin degradation protein MlrC
MKILIAECLHEVCSFNPAPTKYEDFFVNFGDQVLAYHQRGGTEVAGACQVFRERTDMTVIPTFSARGIASGGVIPAADFDRLTSEFLERIRHAGPVNGAYFTLHGAMAAEQESDPEGYLLEESRKILGEKIPIVVSCDLHGILTDRMLQHADLIVPYHTYPHVDFFETGQRAARLLLRCLAGEICPVTAKVEIPALVRGDELITATGIFGRLIGKAQQYERGTNGLAAGYFIGNPFTDVPDLRCYSIVATDNDPGLAQMAAIDLANDFWPHRQKMQAQLLPVDVSVQLASNTPGTVAMVDAADATSSGASGDSNVILRHLIETGYQRRALIPIVDAIAVNVAFAAGVGSTISVNIGGTIDRQRFSPFPITAQVAMLSDGRFRSESYQQEWYSGPTAVLRVGNMTIVTTSRPVHLFDRSLFLAHGQNPRDFDLIVVKSPHCQHHMYAEWCTRLIHVDAPGSTSANLPTLGHTICRRPVYPLDVETEFRPTVKFFSRTAH